MRRAGRPLRRRRRTSTLYSALFNLHSVPRHVLERDGATFRAARSRSSTPTSPTSTRPTSSRTPTARCWSSTPGAGSGSCPTSQIAKPNVRGGDLPDPPRGRRRGWPTRGAGRSPGTGQSPGELARRLDDPRFAVRDRAVARLARQGEAALPALRDVLARRSARARLAGRLGAGADRGAGGAAPRSARPWPTTQDERPAGGGRRRGLAPRRPRRRRLREMVRSDTLPVRREAATALGRLGRREAVPALLDGLRTAPTGSSSTR